MTNEERLITPPELAKRWGVAPEKVLHMIHTGQLIAVNLASNPDGERPRFRIDPAEVRRFEEARSNRKPVPKTRKKPVKTAGKEWFA